MTLFHFRDLDEANKSLNACSKEVILNMPLYEIHT
jgi:hypothetical protein